MPQKAIKTLVIVGGGSAGWMSASFLNHIFNLKEKQIDIKLIESSEVETIGVGEATIHSIRFFLSTIGISEREFMQKTQAIFKHGILFKDWSGQEKDEYYHPFEHPQVNDGIDVVRHWVNLNSNTEKSSRFDFSVSAQSLCASQNKSPKSQGNKDFEGYFPYGYHLDAAKFAHFLRDFSLTKGVKRIEGHVQEVILGTDGDIQRLILKSGLQIDGDFFIDCTGFSSVLMKAMGNKEWVDYSDSLLCDRAVTCQIEHNKENQEHRPYTIATAQKSGWIWDIDLQSRRGMGYVYSSSFCSTEQAEIDLSVYANTARENLSFKHLQMKTGRMEKIWFKNCLAIGLSAGFIEPLESTGIYFIDMGIRFFGDYITSGNVNTLLIDKYNTVMGQLMDQSKDFISLHYTLSKRNDSQFWRAYQHDVPISETLSANLTLWKHKIPTAIDFSAQITQFTSANYTYILYGMKYFPEPAVTSNLFTSEDRSMKNIEYVKSRSNQMNNKLPTMSQFLKNI